MSNYNEKFYKKILDKNKIKKPILKNLLSSFLSGGLICLLGEIIFKIYNIYFTIKESQTYMILTIIFISSLLTALGIFDKLGQLAKAGTIVPICGFANSLTASAIEYKTEGVFLGIASNTFKLAGSVIVFGNIIAFIVSMFYFLVDKL